MVEYRCKHQALHEPCAIEATESDRVASQNMHASADLLAHESASSSTQQKFESVHTLQLRSSTVSEPFALPVHNRFGPLDEPKPQLGEESISASTTEGQVKPSPWQPTQAKPTFTPIPIASWNIGGCSLADAVQAMSRAEGTKPQIVCLQEMPRREVGWNTANEGSYSVVQYRHDDNQWRRNAIAFSPEFQVVRKRGCRFGIWLRLRHLQTHNEMWIGSMRLSTGVNSDVTADELRTVCKLLPPTLLPTLLLGDFNTKLRWTDAVDPQGDLRPTEARSEYVLSGARNQRPADESTCA